jgi:hypothetical protein
VFFLGHQIEAALAIIVVMLVLAVMTLVAFGRVSRLAAGLMVPEALRDVRTNYAQTVKHYDQIAWFMGDLTLLTNGGAGVIDLRGTVFRELTARQVTDRVSDHLPLWAEFVIDRSGHELADQLGLDRDAPDPFVSVPD